MRSQTSKKILVVNDGKTGDFPLKIISYLEEYSELIELKDLRHFQVGELEEETKNYDKTILICKIGFRMRVNQENMIRDLDKQIQNKLQVFYLLKQGAGSYCIADCKAQQMNIFMHDIDEEFIEESLEGFVNATSVGKWRSLLIPIFFLIMLAIASVYSILQLNSAIEDAQICKKLEGEIWQIWQDYIDLIQANKRLVEDHIRIQQDSFQKNEQNYCAQNGDLVKKLEEFQKLILTRGNQSHKGCEEIRNKYDQIVKSKKTLEKDYSEMKEMFLKERQQHEESKKKLVDQKNKNEQITKLVNQFEEDFRNLKKDLINFDPTKYMLFVYNECSA